MTQETAAPAEALLQAQTEVMRQYHGDLLQTIYWGVGTVVIVAFAMAAFNWVTSRKSYKAFHVNPVIFTWKKSLANLLDLYDRNNRPYPRFFALLFLAFVAVNLACYWFAMFTVFPEYTQGMSGVHYFKVQFPVGFLGAVFDSFSFFITIFIVRRALRATSGASYVAHLSVDLLIAIVATWWTLFVFTLSGWIISQFDAQPEQALLYRSQIYEDRALEALRNPAPSWRNIYFGLVMGASAMIPTTIHIGLSFKAYFEVHLLATGRRDEPVEPRES